MTMITKTDAYFKKLDLKLRKSSEYNLTDLITGKIIRTCDLTAFTDYSLSRYELGKLVDLVNIESEKYVLVSKKQYSDLSSEKELVYSLNKKLSTRNQELLLSFTENQLPNNYSSKRFSSLLPN